jgi:branched-chain amino acid transport system substrate-binding protein
LNGFKFIRIANKLKLLLRGGLPVKHVNSLSRKLTARAISISLIAFLIFLTACGGNGGGSTNSGGEKPAEDNSKPIKIGVMLTLSGPFGSVGEGAKKGIELYFETKNYTLNNRKVELIYEDDENNPQVALRKYRKLVDQDKVDVLLGESSSTTLYAVRDEIDNDKIPLIVSLAAGDAIAWEKKSDYIFRSTPSNYQLGYAAGPYAAKHIGKRAYIVSSDTPTGYEQAAAFKASYEENGGQVMKVDYAKPGTSDFATYMAQIAEAKPDVVYSLAAGIDGMRFAMQYKTFGLKEKIPLMTQTPTDLATTPEMVDALNGTYLRFDYNPALDNAANKTFIEAYKKKYGDKALGGEQYGYDSALYLGTAIEKAGSVKSEDLVKVLKDLTYESPRGKVSIDPKTHNGVFDMYMFKYTMKDGKLVMEYLDTVKEVRMPEKAPEKK